VVLGGERFLAQGFVEDGEVVGGHVAAAAGDGAVEDGLFADLEAPLPGRLDDGQEILDGALGRLVCAFQVEVAEGEVEVRRVGPAVDLGARQIARAFSR